ncbi:probable cytochrome P450 318a1 isoform X1 [Drosophila pseudoobscura]|uniref:Probable cytochrome P450 318a1 isoform X1 n=1 Tax=Drosophila pseudoobscura pseudoobscura TaxID=46245 RepID=A0A6I8UZW7_DROPS|nr:probable cytochrome P450 318a1 isoform X1 [Drosophila pseudoobscura]
MHLYVALWVCGTALALLLGWQQRKCWRLIWQLNGWRGVAQQPILWFLLCINLHPNSILERVTQMRKYFQRPLAILVGTRVLVYIDDPAGMESILNAPECLDKTFMQEGFFAKRGLLHARGQKWKLRRKQLNPAFSHNIVASFFDVFNAVGNQMVEQFASQPHLHGRAVKFTDAEDMLSRAVLEVSCLTVMGTPTNFTQTDDAHIASSYKRLLEISAIRVVKPWLQIDLLHRLLAPELYAEAEKCNQLLVEFVAGIVQSKHRNWQLRTALSEGAGEDSTAWQRRIFIEQIFQLAANGELTLQEIEDEAQSMVLVSFETVSNSIMLALLCLATHKGDCQQRLRAEIASVFPGQGQGSTPDAPHVGLEQLQQLRYLDAFVSEALRLLATVPMNLRHVSRDFQLPGREAVVPQNSIIVLDTFNMQREEEWWGDNAKQFDPQRFLDQDDQPDQSPEGEDISGSSIPKTNGQQKQQKQQRRHSYSFLPFSKGLRSCIGRRYGLFIMKVFLVKLIVAFDFSSDFQLDQLQFVENISLKFNNVDDIFLAIQPHQQNQDAT